MNFRACIANVLKSETSTMAPLGDHQPYTTPQRTSSLKMVFSGGGGTDCQDLREQQNIHHPQDCTGDVQNEFCGGGVRIVEFGNRRLGRRGGSRFLSMEVLLVRA